MSDDERNEDQLSALNDSEPEGATAPEAEAPAVAEPAPVSPSPPPAPPPPPPPAYGPYAAPLTGVQVPGGAAAAQGYASPPPYGAPQAPRRRSSTLWVIAVLVVLAVVTLGIVGALMGELPNSASTLSPLTHIGVISIEGIIRDGGEGGFFSGPPGARGIMRQIRAARKDSDVKAVLLLINSPGGSPAASHAIWEEINRLKARKKVVVCMTDVCASGGYYIASAADKIVAQGSTLTGSIGVIMGGIGYYGLMHKLGITNETLTAGKYKDAGSGQRPLTAEERKLLTTMLQDVYNQFIAAVAEGRKLKVSRVRQLAEGRIYTGNQAKAVGLVDEIGNFYDAVKTTATLAGIKGEPRLKYYGQSKGLLSELAGSESVLKRFFGTRPPGLSEMPLQGPMLVMPYSYQMVPMVTGTTFDLR